MITGVVDYKAGNLKSIETALRHLGAEFIISDKPEKLQNCDRLIFPGVGEASSAMKNLKERGLDDLITGFASKGNPLMGICLGCQIILRYSEEGNTKCLGLVDGDVKLFQGRCGEEILKVPQIGWNTLKFTKKHYLFKGIPDNSSFYFVHSYYPDVKNKFMIGETEYGISFSSALSRDNVCAVQFHPEKSGKYGLMMMKNFLKG
ncbi:MAG: imidazole glycerol phosphate synthase subunit HisH [Spirochaetia bacterium]|nr:imidazole glycerol phosphate synthase subunit HisH [Spirochaetia bacterium]